MLVGTTADLMQLLLERTIESHLEKIYVLEGCMEQSQNTEQSYRCSNCGTFAWEGKTAMTYCPRCGAPIQSDQPTKLRKLIWIIFALGLLILLIGRHF
jgi:uncharacterized paraquat-inducible protein A